MTYPYLSPGDVDFKIGGFKQDATVSQEVIKKLTILSNGNVDLQHRFNAIDSRQMYRLRCSRCNVEKKFDDMGVITTLAEHRMESRILNTFVEFCKEHQHAPTVQASDVTVFDTSRKYR